MSINTTTVVAVLLGSFAWTTVARADNPPRPDPATDQLGGGASGDVRPWAKGVTKAEQEAALSLFRDGNKLVNDGLFEQAAEKYKAALTHWDHPQINYMLARSLSVLKQPLEVDAALKKALQYGRDALEEVQYDGAQQLLTINAQLLAEIEVTCQKPGADVSIDGQHVFTGPGKVSKLVKIGKHTIVAQKPGAISKLEAPNIGPQEHFRIELKLYTPEELTRYRRKWQATWAPYVVMGAGAVIVGGGGLFELSARSSYRQFDQAVASCSMNNSGCATTNTAVLDLRKSGDTKQTIAYVGYGIGAATLLTGGVLAFINRREAYQIRAEDVVDPPEPAGITFAPIVTPGMAGGMVQGHF